MKPIPYGRQTVDQADRARVDEVLRGDWITQGPEIGRFEEGLRNYTGARYAVAVSSGTAALHIACLAIGLNKGDTALAPALTFAATANAVLYVGARVLFSDIDSGTLNVTAAMLSECVSRARISKRMRAVLPVHFAGLPCELKEIRAFARRKGALVIEDAAHALGAVYRGQKIGSCRESDIAIFSFHPVKSITTGEGGAIMTNDRALYKRILALRTHGIVKDRRCAVHGPWHYEMRCLGFNYRMTDLQAALGSSQLKKLDSFIARRAAIADRYRASFSGSPYFDLPDTGDANSQSAWHLYPIRLKGRLKGKRKKVFIALRKKGVLVQVHYIPVYYHPYYEALGFRKGLCPNAERYYENAISLPIFPGLTSRLQSKVIAAVRGVTEEIAR